MWRQLLRGRSHPLCDRQGRENTAMPRPWNVELALCTRRKEVALCYWAYLLQTLSRTRYRSHPELSTDQCRRLCSMKEWQSRKPRHPQALEKVGQSYGCSNLGTASASIPLKWWRVTEHLQIGMWEGDQTQRTRLLWSKQTLWGGNTPGRERLIRNKGRELYFFPAIWQIKNSCLFFFLCK